MRALVIACFLTLLALPASASDTDVEHIDELAQAAVDAFDTSEYTNALADLDAARIDPVTVPACRKYADAALIGLVLIDVGNEYPDSEAAQSLFAIVMQALPVYRNDCLLAI